MEAANSHNKTAGIDFGAHIASLNRETTETGFNSIIGTFKNQKSDGEDEEEAPAMTSARQSELAAAYSLCLDDALNQPEFKQLFSQYRDKYCLPE